MSHDNLFWNKVQKDLAFLLVRSLGFMPAPMSVTNPERSVRWQHWQDLEAYYKLQRHLRQQ